MPHVINWDGMVLEARDMTLAFKQLYCKWLFCHMLENYRSKANVNQYNRFERKLSANPPEWSSIADDEVVESLNQLGRARVVPGVLQVLRLLLVKVEKSEGKPDQRVDLTPEVMTDEEILAMVTAKSQDPNSDYSVAMRLVREGADPKARRDGGSSPRPGTQTDQAGV